MAEQCARFELTKRDAKDSFGVDGHVFDFTSELNGSGVDVGDRLAAVFVNFRG